MANNASKSKYGMNGTGKTLVITSDMAKIYVWLYVLVMYKLAKQTPIKKLISKVLL